MQIIAQVTKNICYFVFNIPNNIKYVFFVTCAISWTQYCISIFLACIDRAFSELLFIIIGFVPDITTWKIHEQIVEGDMSTEDQRNKQEAKKRLPT
jgi:hypothetical protein